MATTYWQNKHSQALILPTKEGTSITIPQAGYVKDESGTYYTTSFGLTSVSNPGSVVYAYTYPADPVDQVGVPGGATGTVQYNDEGSFGGITGSEWDGSTLTISEDVELTGAVTVGAITTGAVTADSVGTDQVDVVTLNVTGPLTATPSTDIVPLTVRAFATGVNHIVQFQDSGNGALAAVTHTGGFLGESVQLNTGTRPAANAENRGKIWYVAGGAGVPDTIEICAKDTLDAYAWIPMATIA